MGALGLAAGAIGFYGVAPAQLLTVTSAFSVFMVCSAAGGHLNSNQSMLLTPPSRIILAQNFALVC